MKQLIYISGRAHSGSTLLDLMLGGHPRLIGVGEVYSLFDPARDFLNRPNDVRCSCGRQMDKCEFWSPTMDLLRSAYSRKAGNQELYRMFLSSFHSHFGSDAIPVDISKTDEALGVLKGLDGIKIKVIFMVRDVRSWTVSMRDAARRAKDFEISDLIRKYGWMAWKSFVGRMSSKFFWHWYILNRRTQRLLKETDLPAIQVGYEELCLYPEFIMRRISEFLEIDYNETMLSLADVQSHVILGNRMRSQPEKRQRVAYDDRWFHSSEWMLPAVIFPHIMRYNAREVYRNVRDHIWNT
jgi:hypothetical protein